MKRSATDEQSDVGVESREPLSRNPFTGASTSIDMEQLSAGVVTGAGASSTGPTAPPAPTAPLSSSRSAVRHLYLLRDIVTLSTSPSSETLRSVYTHTMPRNSSLDNTMTQHPLSSNDPPGWRQMGANPTRMSGNNEHKMTRSISLREGERLPLCGGPKKLGSDSEPGVPPNSDPTTSQNASTENPTQSTDCNSPTQRNNNYPNLNDKFVMEIARFLPILFIFLVKFAYDHWEGILYALLIQLVQFYLNSALKTEVALLEYKRFTRMIFNYLLGSFVVGWRLYIATKGPDPFGLILPPTKDCVEFVSDGNKVNATVDVVFEPARSEEHLFEKPTPPQDVLGAICSGVPLGELLHFAILSDLLLQIIIINFKTLITMLPIGDMRFRGRLYALIEYITQFYRALTPIKQWCLFFYLTYDEDDTIISVLLCLYIFFKFFELWFRLTSLRHSFINLTQKIDSKRLPTKDELDKADNMCAICNDPYRSPVILDCGHIFCDECLQQWLKRGKTCPICRAKVSDHPLYQDGSTSASYQIY